MGDVTQLDERRSDTTGASQKLTRYVRITNPDHNGFVEFDFAVGDPTIALEMILPQPAFAEFCATNAVVFLTAEQERAVDRDKQKWRYGADNE